MVGQPFLDVDDSFGERCGLGSAQQVPVLFHRSTAPSRVDHDRASVAADRQRSDGGLRPTASIGAEPGMGMQCAAARGDIGRRRDAKPGGLDDPLTRMVDVSLPGIHDTAGEKEDIVTAWLSASFVGTGDHGAAPGAWAQAAGGPRRQAACSRTGADAGGRAHRRPASGDERRVRRPQRGIHGSIR